MDASSASLVPAPPAADDVLLLRLRDGGVRFGAIAGHDANKLDFTLLGNGGLVHVPWTMLEPSQANELQLRFGYIDVASDEILVDGERLVLTSGGSVEGIIVSREGDSYWIKSEGNLQAVPKIRVASIESGLRLSALDVYSTDELYNQYAGSVAADDPAAQWELAVTCERIYAFGKALEHYQKVREIDPAYRADELANILTRVEAKAAQQEQLDYLRNADRLRKRGQWDASLEALDAFAGLFKKSPLINDAVLQRARLISAREAAAKDYVAKRWFYWMRRLARDLSRESNLAAARTYVDERLSEEIQKAVLADLQRTISKDAQLEQVKKIFAERKKVRFDASSYGIGTWLIGEEAARRGLVEEDEPKGGPVNATDGQRQELENRIKQFMKNQRVASRGKQAEAKEDLAQLFWESWTGSSRTLWLIAYYAENSGDLEVRVRPDLQPCRTCAGKGALEVLLTGGGGAPDDGGGGGRGGRGGRGGNTSSGDGGLQLQKCPVCQGVGVVRRVHFR